MLVFGRVGVPRLVGSEISWRKTRVASLPRTGRAVISPDAMRASLESKIADVMRNGDCCCAASMARIVAFCGVTTDDASFAVLLAAAPKFNELRRVSGAIAKRCAPLEGAA